MKILPIRLCLECCTKLLRNVAVASYHSSVHGYRLVEEGKLESPREASGCCYQAGQYFLHGVFSYRGVVLYPWKVRVFDRDTHDSISSSDSAGSYDFQDGERLEEEVDNPMKTLTPELKVYYTTLMDMRDVDHMRTPPELLTVTDNGSPCGLPGLDYVSHDDVVPYTKTSNEPFGNVLLSHFVIPPNGETQDLKTWREITNRWLNLSQVHSQTTSGIKVTVIPFYIGVNDTKEGKKHTWRYSIRIQSTLQEQFQLVERYWRICHASGELLTVREPGVLGMEPKFSSIQPAFQYSSHVALPSPTGHMWGTFLMRRPDNTTFEVRVPPFSLESP